MQHNSSVDRTAYAAVADAHHVADDKREQFLRQWHVPDFRHPGVPLGPQRQHQHGVRIELGSSIRAARKSSMLSKTRARPRCWIGAARQQRA
jgi:hypothetical protein